MPSSPTTTGVYVGTMWSGTYSYFDFAPEPGGAPLSAPIAFSTVAPPPPPPPPAQPVVQTPPPVVTSPTPAPIVSTSKPSKPAAGCKVPSVKRLRSAVAKQALKHAGCRLGVTSRAYGTSVPAGRVVSTSPKAGTAHWQEEVDLVVSKGRKPKRKHRAHKAAALDVRARLDAAARALAAHRAG